MLTCMRLSGQKRVLSHVFICMVFWLVWLVDSRAAMTGNISAGMETAMPGPAFHARVFIKGEKVRVMVTGGRQYKKMAVAAINRRVPRFFDPDLQIDKTKIAEESINGRPAIKYEAKIADPGGMRYQGFLWELVDLPDLPARWEDGRLGIVVQWQDIAVSELDDAIFEIRADSGQFPSSRPTAYQGQQRQKMKEAVD